MNNVLLTDDGIPFEIAPQRFERIARWAKQHCYSLKHWHMQDVSDCSLVNDYSTMFYFQTREDAEKFLDRWGGTLISDEVIEELSKTG